MEDRLISELDYVGSSGYTLNDLLVLVNYDVAEGTTKNTKITDLKNYVLSSVSASTNATITGFTYNENTFTLYDNSGSTFSASINSLTGLTINGNLTVTGTTSLDSINVNTISATTYQNLPLDVFVTGGTYTNGEITFRNNADNNFTVNGLPIGGAGGQVYYLNISQTQSPYKEFSPIESNSGEQFATVSIPSGTSSTIESFLTPVGYPNTSLIPAAYWSFYLHTYKEDSSANFDLYCDVYIRASGGSETYLFSTDPTDNILESPNVTMILTDGYFSGCSINSSDRILIKVNATNTGFSTKTITLFSEGSNHYSYCITPFSSSSALNCENLSGCSTIQIIQSNLTTKLNKSGDTMSGTLYVPTISATTYQGLPLDVRITGGTYSNNTFTYTNNSGGTFNTLFNTVSGLTVNGNLTVTGTTSIKALTATTISATTYQGLPLDVRVTGSTYSNNTFTYTNNTGGTFSTLFNTVSGLTVNGNLTVTGTTSIKALTATTISATTYSNLPTDIRVTGSTYSNNTFTYTNNTGGTFSTLFNTMTGLTVNGNIIVSGGTQSWFSGNSSSDLVRITQTGSGNALVVEDSTNPDASPFVVSPTGNVGIGVSSPSDKLVVSGKTVTSTIQISSGGTVGYVLTSDASGNGTWSSPSSSSLTNYIDSSTTSVAVGDTSYTVFPNISITPAAGTYLVNFTSDIETSTNINDWIDVAIFYGASIQTATTVRVSNFGNHSQRGSVATQWILTANGSTAVAPYYRTNTNTNDWTLYNRVLTLIKIG